MYKTFCCTNSSTSIRSTGQVAEDFFASLTGFTVTVELYNRQLLGGDEWWARFNNGKKGIRDEISNGPFMAYNLSDTPVM